MITIRLNGENPVSTRFVISPIWDTMTSYYLLTLSSDQYPNYYEWVSETYQTLDGLPFPYLDVLFKSKRFFPDFLTPPVTRPIMNIYDEIEAIRATPPNLVKRDIDEVRLRFNSYTPDEELILQEYVEQPDTALERLVSEVEMYWRLTLARHWPRMQEILEADILYRARQLALGGVEMVFAELDPTVTYENLEIRFKKKSDHSGEVESDRVILIPLIFSCQSPFSLISPEWYPSLSYQPRGWGMWREAGQFPASDALELTVGAGRAKILQSLIQPASTGELAHRLNITAGAVSQHMARLSQAGLVTSMHSGKRVYHQLTQRG
ncbi:MAG: winged helix-turn-helix domain-containing protein, partial [Anaerolineae bacterium]|nr:winged helix-turn-helix domain-containing protein [Anaerolineae bacterium]